MERMRASIAEEEARSVKAEVEIKELTMSQTVEELKLKVLESLILNQQ